MRKDLIALLGNLSPSERAEVTGHLQQQKVADSAKAVKVVAEFCSSLQKVAKTFKNLPLAVAERFEKDLKRYEAMAAAGAAPDTRPNRKAAWWQKVTGFQLKDGSVLPPEPAAQVVARGLKFAPKTFVHPQHRPAVGKTSQKVDDKLWLATHWEAFAAATGTALLTGDSLKKAVKKVKKPTEKPAS